jgi:hypothetical protein
MTRLGVILLPFLAKNKAQPGVIVKDAQTSAPETPQEDPAILACADDLISAVHAKDTDAVASALRAAFDIMQSMPEESAVEPHSYEAQNIAAAETE